MSLLPSSLPSSPLFCSRRRVAIASGKRCGRFKALGESSSEHAKEVCLLRDYSDRLSKYEQVWDLQKRLVQSKTLQLGANENENRDRDGKGEGEATTCHDLILVQHEPVYTLGAGSTLAHVKFDVDDPPFPIFRTERGGEVTYHGPGQVR
jgi:lipoyl(octanoyl) transferase